MKEAIIKAIVGGWEPEMVDFTDMDIDRRGLLFFEDFPENKREDIESSYVYFYDTEYPEEGYYAGMLMELALLDKNFWQALIPKEHKVTLNLPEMNSTSMGKPWHRPKQTATYLKKTPNRWKTVWHRFFDHLAEGKDAEDFFTNLLPH